MDLGLLKVVLDCVIIFIAMYYAGATLKSYKLHSAAILHLYELLDLLKLGCQDPVASIMYDLIREKGRTTRPEEREKIFEAAVTKVHENTVADMKRLLESTDDPCQKHKLQTVIDETESVMTLMRTLSVSSSKEYVAQIKREVVEASRRIKKIQEE